MIRLLDWRRWDKEKRVTPKIVINRTFAWHCYCQSCPNPYVTHSVHKDNHWPGWDAFESPVEPARKRSCPRCHPDHQRTLQPGTAMIMIKIIYYHLVRTDHVLPLSHSNPLFHHDNIVFCHLGHQYYHWCIIIIYDNHVGSWWWRKWQSSLHRPTSIEGLVSHLQHPHLRHPHPHYLRHSHPPHHPNQYLIRWGLFSFAMIGSGE